MSLVDADGDGLGAAVRTSTVYDSDHPYADFDASGSLTTRYLWAMDQLFARIGASGVGWYLGDRLGSVRQIVDASGNVLDDIDFASFGQVLNETSPENGDRFKFAMGELVGGTGLQNHFRRWYDSASGRWMSQDPLGFDAGDTNLYRYVHNGPTNYTDPSGEILPLLIVGGIIVWGAGMGSLYYAESQYNAASDELALPIGQCDQAKVNTLIASGDFWSITGQILGWTGIVLVGASLLPGPPETIFIDAETGLRFGIEVIGDGYVTVIFY